MSRAAIVDAVEREAALDPSRSCIVQAPAGSGKTGLLIQRLLRLLATVERPEEVLAITFTRKAAAEMRRRVLQALERAAGDAPAEGGNERLTWELARAALARDAERGWELRDNAARLRIQTIDSLCASLARQMPVLSGLGAPPAIVEKPHELHREAAERTLALVEADEASSRAAGRILRHLDGDWAAARGLLEDMLAKRDQWMRRVMGFDADDAARAALEAAFVAERADTLARVRALMPKEEEPELVILARFAAENVPKAAPGSRVAALAAMERYPAADESGAAMWCALADLLLKAGGEPRERVNKNHGFPPGKGEQAVFKERMRSLLERLAAVPGLCEALHATRAMPPARFTGEQWEVLGSMVRLLKLAAAQLQLVFAERGEIDFPGLAQAAVRALGEEDAPTDLLLAMDLRISHLLVDEFQDTSHGQWELLARLTAGWSEGDGRTVFLVGDPMQSIYRFREADVALFLRAWHEGLPAVPLTPVRLSTNFRSQAGIVEWVNAAFGRILGSAENAQSGAVPYAASDAHHAREPGLAVRWHAFIGRKAAAVRPLEGQCVAEVTRAALDAGPGSVAILVRNRSHLDCVVPSLRAAGIRYRAVDIEPLAGRPLVQDLFAITRALSHLGDRIAWLALLRAPWCGLGAADLHALACSAESPGRRDATVWELLHDEDALGRMGAEGRARAQRLAEVMDAFVSTRLRGSLRERVEQAWLALGGPACAEHAADLDDAETFFDQLDAIEQAGDLADPTVLEEHLAELYAAPDVGEEARVQLMTIHKAKGLEFDTVIVPGLDRPPRGADRALLAWKARPDGALMMAPVRPSGQKDDPAYDYLRALESAACEHEAERLLYVAATRARLRLHLCGCARFSEADAGRELCKPPAGSLLAKAWSVASAAFEAAMPAAEDEEAPLPPAAPRDALRRLEIDVSAVRVPAPRTTLPPAASDDPPRIEFSWVGETARHVGIVTHRWLQRIGMEGLERWDAARISALRPAVMRELARRGVPPAERDAAGAQVAKALLACISDERGRWILAAHPESRFEYRVRVASPEGVRLLVIDRVFTGADGRRWIVDYKTSSHEGGDPERFLDRELQRYSPQLGRYARALGSAVGLGLYFPLMAGWREAADGDQMPSSLQSRATVSFNDATSD